MGAPNDTLDPQVAKVLLEVADDFIESTTVLSSQLAKHRKSNVLEVQDLKLHLEKTWGLKVPGFGEDAVKAPATKPSTAHKQRLQAIARTAKKVNTSNASSASPAAAAAAAAATPNSK